MYDRRRFVVFIVLFFVVFVLFLVASVRAEQLTEPYLLITWRTRTYVPGDYQGKVLPTVSSPLIASVELLDNGRLIDLSKRTIYWYLNDELAQNTLGTQQLRFRAGKFPGQTIDLRVEVPSYRGKTILKTVEVPVVSPEVVIKAPFYGEKFSDVTLRLSALPYFFNVAKTAGLTYAWSVNDEVPKNSENPEELIVALPQNTPRGFNVKVAITVSQPIDELLGVAQSTRYFSYEP